MTLILGANGQLGRALRVLYPDARFLSRAEFDVTDVAAYDTFPFADVSTVINAAA